MQALSASGGDHQQATEWLRKKGLAGADKKAGRAAAEGAIFSYIHTGDKCAGSQKQAVCARTPC